MTKKRVRKKSKKSNLMYGRVAEELSKVRLGRYPFLAGVKHYALRKSVRYTKTTITEDTKKLRRFAETFEQFKDAGKIQTTDPRQLGADAIEAFYIWMKSRGLGNSAQGTYVRVLKRYLEMWGNYVIAQMENDDEIIIQSARGDSEINALSIDEVRAIFAALDRMTGYKGIMMRLLISLGVGTGCRPKELFDAEIGDINVGAETFFIRHPKGEGSWGKREKVNIIRKDMVIRIERELKARDEYLKSMNVKSKYVFVNPDLGKPYAHSTFRRQKKEVEALAGVQFMIKDLRSTLLTLLVGEDLSRIGAASKQLTHRNIATTEEFYLKINKRRAVKNALGDRWKEDIIE